MKPTAKETVLKPALMRRTPTLHSLGIDATDLLILETLQHQGRTKRNELAEIIGLSLPAVSERMRKLEEKGLLRGTYGLLNAKALGLDVSAFIFVVVESSSNYTDFLRSAAAHPEVLEIHAITGDGSHLLKVRTWNSSTLEQLLSEIQRWPGVRSTRTNVVLSTAKETLDLPITELEQASGADGGAPTKSRKEKL